MSQSHVAGALRILEEPGSVKFVEEDKVTAKDALDSHSATIFGLYGASMNEHLAILWR